MGRFAIPTIEGSTRLCLDPWAKAFVRADGRVCLCCHAPPIGSLHEKSLKEVLEGTEARQYRVGLLSGAPLHHCQTCPDRQSTTVENLTEKVLQFLETGTMDVF